MKKSYTYTVSAQDVDFSQQIRLTHLVNYLLDSAGRNAVENNFGIQQLLAENHSWVLSRLAVEIKSYPSQNEEFKIETWVEEVGRLFTIRNFCILRHDNSLLGVATSIWAMIDMNTRKAVNLQEKYGDFSSHEPSLCEKPQKIPALKVEKGLPYEVKYSDIDLNWHTNSVKYIEWMLDFIPNPLCFFSEKGIRRFEINYVNEALFGNSLQLFREKVSDSEMIFEIKRNQESICKMRIFVN